MKEKDELIGKQFGNWTVLSYQGKDKNNKHIYLCKCNCKRKTERTVGRYELLNGRSNSCGCTRGQCFVKDLTGQKFGKLTVIKKYGHRNNKITWLCKCDCGNDYITTGELLKQGQTKSCGCIKRTNKYIFKNYYIIGITEKGERFYFDIEDFKKVNQYTWYVKPDDYIEATDKNGNTVSLHRLVMDAKKNETVDHKNHGVNDNRKRNLRKCTVSQNQMNKKKQKNNTSGVVGVSWFPTRNRWVARISANKKRIVLGYFKNFDDAVKVRKEAEDIYHGEFAYKNNDDIRFKKVVK